MTERLDDAVASLDYPRPPGQVAPEDDPRIARLLEGLNEPQREAVLHGEGPLLVLAGAGSGKTRVLTHRLAYLIFTGQAQPGELLAITFTNKAAREMRDRVELLIGRSTRALWLMTFHAACTRMLRSEAERLGYTRQFTIYDQADARRLIKHCLSELSVDPKRFTPAVIGAQISDAKSRLRDAAAYRELISSYFEQTVADVYDLYERELVRMNAMDFDDLLARAVDLLELFPEVRNRYASSFRHVLVDEYQDTNPAQYRWLQLLVGGGRRPPAQGAPADLDGHRNLMVVGDDAQSIYGFRQADIRNILDFQDDFPQARVIKLEQNYRSTQTILSAANAVIANNRGQMAKRLWTAVGPGDPIKLRELDDEHAEARFVVGEIERLVDEGVSRSEIAVFYRMNSQSRILEDTLVRREIDYQVIGGTKFYERAEVKDAIAYLTMLSNPSETVSFTRIANSPRRGIGQTSLSRVIAHSATQGIDVWDAAAASESVPGLGAAAIKALGRFMDTMTVLRERMQSGAPVGELLETVLSRTGYVEALEAERTFEAQGRIENLQELIKMAGEFDASAPDGERSLQQFLEQVALVSDSDARRDEEGLVTLMTLHNAKGLEYPIVFILGCEEGVFPHSRSIEEGSLEEERRLFYVGITRAMRDLYLTSARRRTVFGAMTFGARSRFIDELPEELLDVEQLAPAGQITAARLGRGRGLLADGGGGAGQRRWGPMPTHDGAGAARPSAPSLRIGDDVVHAAFGEGVVTGTQPGGIVMVRFALDGSERKLIADFAPLTKR